MRETFGVGLEELLTVIFIALKIRGDIDWDWGWLIVLWIPFIINMIFVFGNAITKR